MVWLAWRDPGRVFVWDAACCDSSVFTKCGGLAKHVGSEFLTAGPRVVLTPVVLVRWPVLVTLVVAPPNRAPRIGPLVYYGGHYGTTPAQHVLRTSGKRNCLRLGAGGEP